MKTRQETAHDFHAAPDVMQSGLRRLDMQAIALLELIGSPMLAVMLDGAPYENITRLELLKYAWILSNENRDEVISICYAAKNSPIVLDVAVLKWSQGLTPEKMAEFVADFLEDSDDIGNASATIIDNSRGESKN